MVVAVDYARARPHPGHVRPSPSWQWLAAAAPRPSLAAPRPRPAAPRQPRLGHEKNGVAEPRPGRAKNGAAGIGTHNLVVRRRMSYH
jgi:hypothetical protein